MHFTKNYILPSNFQNLRYHFNDEKVSRSSFAIPYRTVTVISASLQSAEARPPFHLSISWLSSLHSHILSDAFLYFVYLQVFSFLSISINLPTKSMWYVVVFVVCRIEYPFDLDSLNKDIEYFGKCRLVFMRFFGRFAQFESKNLDRGKTE